MTHFFVTRTELGFLLLASVKTKPSQLTSESEIQEELSELVYVLFTANYEKC